MNNFEQHKDFLLGKSKTLMILTFLDAVGWDFVSDYEFAESRLRLGHPIGLIFFFVGGILHPFQTIKELFVPRIRRGLVWW